MQISGTVSVSKLKNVPTINVRFREMWCLNISAYTCTIKYFNIVVQQPYVGAVNCKLHCPQFAFSTRVYVSMRISKDLQAKCRIKSDFLLPN
jgi:hypothetical protein